MDVLLGRIRLDAWGGDTWEHACTIDTVGLGIAVVQAIPIPVALLDLHDT